MTTPPGNATLQWWLDIDYAVVQMPQSVTSGEQGALGLTLRTQKIITTNIDSSSPLLTYSGKGWSNGPPLQPQNYYNTTAKITAVVGDTCSFQ